MHMKITLMDVDRQAFFEFSNKKAAGVWQPFC